VPTVPPMPVFPRPPTMCVACPHLGVYYTLSQLRNVTISGDIGCYTLGFGQPWNALDACISMGARWAWRWVSTRGVANPKRTRRSSP
jgi:indolepyruvate ferredoxin oxidoreductase alpha subunit